MLSLMENLNPLSMVLREVQRADEDAIDRLNRRASTLLFCVLAVASAVVQFTGEVIKCWTPQHFSNVWVDYVNSYCWIANTYHVSMAHTDILPAPRREIVYYQWVPIALLLQAAGFYAPSIVWSVFKRELAVDVKRTVAMFSRPECINPSVLDDAANAIAKGFDRSLRYGRQPSQQQLQLLGSSARVIAGLRGVGGCGSWAISGYLLSKVLYLLNVVLQLCALNFFLGTDYSLYGIDMVRDLATNGTYHESPRFPRVTWCNFELRELGKRMSYTVQCTLPVNLFNEKMYVFIWFWLVALALASGFALVRFVCELFFTSRASFVSSYLRVGATAVEGKTEDVGGLKDEERLLVREFCREYLHYDGYFALRLIASNTSDVATSKLMLNMWNLFKQRRAQLKGKEQAAV